MKNTQTLKIGEQAFLRLKGMIEQGTWPTGDRLPSERELCQLLGVSHTTVRSALQRLCALGLLETRPGSGSYVLWRDPRSSISSLFSQTAVPMDTRFMRDVLEFREMLECYAARLAAERASKDTVVTLAELCRRLSGISSPEESAAADASFHLAVGVASGNAMIIRTYEILSTFLASSILEEIRQRGITRQQHHRDLVDAIASHDGTSAEAIMRIHLLSQRRCYEIPEE